jgi:hypothetical protein
MPLAPSVTLLLRRLTDRAVLQIVSTLYATAVFFLKQRNTP